MTFHTLVFDLDGTLYPRANGLYTAIMERIGTYLQRALDLTPEDAQVLRRRFFVQYGTALRGLMTESQVDVEVFLHEVHDIDVGAYLQPDPDLATLLAGLPQRKLIFTNASREHARRVLQALGVDGQFEAIVDVRTMEFRPKPDPFAYHILAQYVSAPLSNVLFLDDEPRNLPPAAQLGLSTLLVHPDPPTLDPSAQRIPDIKALYAWLRQTPSVA